MLASEDVLRTLAEKRRPHRGGPDRPLFRAGVRRDGRGRVPRSSQREPRVPSHADLRGRRQAQEGVGCRTPTIGLKLSCSVPSGVLPDEEELPEGLLCSVPPLPPVFCPSQPGPEGRNNSCVRRAGSSSRPRRARQWLSHKGAE